MPYQVFEHTADIGLQIEAPDLAGLFADAARGLFAVVRGENPVGAHQTETIEVQADRLDRLLVAFLEEFIFLQDAEGLVFHDVRHVSVASRESAWHASAQASGEPFSHERHPGCLHVKAVTRHELAVGPPHEGRPAHARIILDI